MPSCLRSRWLMLAICWTAVLGTATPALADDTPAPARFKALVTEFLHDYYERNPTYAGDLGLHEYDGRLEDASQAAIKAEAVSLKRTREQLAAIDASALDLTDRLRRPD